MNCIRKNLPSLVSFSFFVFCLWAISQKLDKYSFQDVLYSLGSISKTRQSGALFLMMVSYGMTTAYDILAFCTIHHPLRYSKIALTSFISYALSNNVGLPILTGSAIRYRLYSSWGVSPGAIAQVIAFTNITFWIGLLGVCGLVFLVSPLQIPTLLDFPFVSVRPIGAIFVIAILCYLLWGIFSHKAFNFRGWELSLPSPGLAIALIIFAAIDWGAAAGVLYLLLPSVSVSSYLSCFSLYLLAMVASMVSNVPGGLGVFETVVMLLVNPSTNPAEVLASLLVYRVIYYFIPLFVATVLLGVYEFQYRK